MSFKPTYLYIKIHNKTGLKYFGKTTSKNPHKYRGSGSYWLRHIKVHGYDVTTIIVGHYIDEDECRLIAAKFSADNELSTSDQWANLIDEELSGSFEFINSNGLDHKGFSSRQEKNMAISPFHKGGERAEEIRKLAVIGLKTFFKDEEKVKEWKEKIKQTKLANGTFNIAPRLPETANEKRKETLKRIGHQQGSKNSNYGTMWITNGEGNKKIKRDAAIPDGWRKGRKLNKEP